VLALAIWWVVRREVLAPVDRLAGVAAAVADGDLSARAGSLSGGELGQLGKQVDAMTGRLGAMIEQASQQGSSSRAWWTLPPTRWLSSTRTTASSLPIRPTPP
jgi:methyl-accepting chemotaxis protein